MSGAAVRRRFRAPEAAAGASELAASRRAQPSRAALQLALAHAIERRIEAGALPAYAAAARSLGLTRARLTQLMSMLLLAPEVQEGLLLGALDVSGRSLRAVVREPDWRNQLAVLARESEYVAP